MDYSIFEIFPIGTAASGTNMFTANQKEPNFKRIIIYKL